MFFSILEQLIIIKKKIYGKKIYGKDKMDEMHIVANIMYWYNEKKE